MKGDSIVSSLVSSYGLEWRSNQKQQNRQQSQKQPNTNSVRKGTNTTLSGNQGSPQPGAPKSHSVSRTGNKTYRIGAIQKLAMAMPCSKWKGDTKHSETECETELWREGNGLRLYYGSQGPLRFRSDVLFQASSSLETAKRSCGASCFQN